VNIVDTTPMHYCPQNGASITIAVPSNSGL